MFPSVLIVDDEPSICQSLAGLLSDEGFQTITALNGYEALKIIESESPDIVLLDIWMHGIDGIETLKEIKKKHPYIQVVMITGHGRIDTAVTAIKIGAFDFIEKPLSIDKVIVAINNALNFRRLQEENKYLRKKTIEKHTITGNSSAAIKLKKDINIAAPTDAWILIKGENGTGKELVANSIHLLSDRAEKPMIDVNCASISNDYMDIELLGHEKGAYPDSAGKRIGKFELANHGTIFFDEIGDMTLGSHGKILRVLQERKFTRIGGTRLINLDVRVIASTNKDLEKEIEAGNFREDLYYRLNVIPISVPPLRDRKDDIPEMIEVFLNECVRKGGFAKKRLTKAAIKSLQTYTWPGNVRELKNLVERLAITVKKDIIGKRDIPPPYVFSDSAKSDKKAEAEKDIFDYRDLKKAKIRFEDEFIKKNLKKFEDDVSKTAKAISVTKNYLMKQLKRIKKQEDKDCGSSAENSKGES